MQKISAGYYKTVINGFDIEVVKNVMPDGEITWYSTLSKDGKRLLEGDDYEPTKKKALYAITYVANHPEEYLV